METISVSSEVRLLDLQQSSSNENYKNAQDMTVQQIMDRNIYYESKLETISNV